jgi:hypothetical protein
MKRTIGTLLIFFVIITITNGQATKTTSPCREIKITRVEYESIKLGKNTVSTVQNELALPKDLVHISFYLDSLATSGTDIYYILLGSDAHWNDCKGCCVINYDIQKFKKGHLLFMIREYNCTGEMKTNKIALVSEKAVRRKR